MYQSSESAGKLKRQAAHAMSQSAAELMKAAHLDIWDEGESSSIRNQPKGV